MMPTMEPFVCLGCGLTCQRRAGRSNPKQYCNSKKCQAIKRLGHDKPVDFSSLSPRNASPYYAEMNYYGEPRD